MDRYYYLAAALPLLRFTERPSLSKEDFISQAVKWLTPRDFLILSRIDVNNVFRYPEDPSLLVIYKEFEYSLRRELALYRAALRRGQEYKHRGDLREIIQQLDNPLQIERALLLLRWDFLEEQEFGHFFDLDFLIVYYLKLQILQRLFSFDKEKGNQRFESYSSVGEEL